MKPISKSNSSNPAIHLFYFGLVIFLLLVSYSANTSSQTNRKQTSTQTPSQALSQSNQFLGRIENTTTPTLLKLSACVADANIRIRRGPGTQYETIGGLSSGTCITILGRNPDSSWAYIVTEDKQTGWVAGWLLTINGNLSSSTVKNVANPLPTSIAELSFNQNNSSSSNNSQNNGSSSQDSNAGQNGGDTSQDSNNPVPNNNGPTALCQDGTYSYSTNRQGTCSHHGGVAQWLN